MSICYSCVKFKIKTKEQELFTIRIGMEEK